MHTQLPSCKKQECRLLVVWIKPLAEKRFLVGADHNHEYLNQGWKNMAQPTWDPTEAAGSSAPVASSHLWKPALLPHYSPASIPLPFHAPQVCGLLVRQSRAGQHDLDSPLQE